MRFSKLINSLQHQTTECQQHYLAEDPEIINGASLDQAKSNQISFLEIGNSLSLKLTSTRAGAVLLPQDESLISIAKEKNIAWLVLGNPRLGFAKCLELLNPKPLPVEGIHPSAVIGKNVHLGENLSIGANVCVGQNCQISDGCIIHPGVVIYENVLLGSGTEIHANCVIHPYSNIGENCVIHSNAVIGSEGFGFIPTEKGWYKMPQTGIVLIENDVEIGCNSTIDRPAVGETRIGAGTKIDNLVQIGHGVSTGKGCAMAAQVGIAGGAKIGHGVILAGQVGVANRVKVGDGVIASSKCGVHTDIEPGQVISGFPALPNKLWLRCSANFRKLPEMARSLRELTRPMPK